MGTTGEDCAMNDLPPGLEKTHFTREGNLDIHDLINKLRNNYSFFREMTENEMVGFFRLCGRESFEKGQIIFQEGDPGRSFYLLISGELTIIIRNNEVARLGPGQIFGEMAVLENAPRSATATATEKSLVFCIEREILTDVMPSLGYKVAVNIAKDLSRKLREANSLIK